MTAIARVLLLLCALSGCATPGARIRVAFNAGGETAAWAQGIADPRDRRRVTPDDPVRVASVSKLVVALGVMRLVEQGVLDLDADVSDRLGWRLRHPAFPDRPITLRLLLSHRSGLTDAADYALPLGADLRAHLANPTAWDADHPPGGHFRYANLNFPVVASVMERTTGERFDLLMRRLVLAPLGLAACFNWASCDARTVAKAVVLTDRAGTMLRDGDAATGCPVNAPSDMACDLSLWRPGTNGALFSPQGGLRISARGLARIGRMLLGKGTLDGARFLSPASVETMLTPIWTYDGANGLTGEFAAGTICRYGLATQILATPQAGCGDDLFGDGRPRVGHAGDAYGLRSGLWIDRAAGTGVAYFVTAVPDDEPAGRGTAFTRAETRISRARP